MKIERIMMIRPGMRFSHIAFGPPLGFLYLISLLREHFPGRFEIEFIHQALLDLSRDELKDRMKKFDPDLVCLSAMSLEHKETAEAARISKDLKPERPVILGGPHATIFYDLVLRESMVDVAVIGEGELTFIELLTRLLNDEPLDNVKGIAFLSDPSDRSSSDIVLTGPREFIEDLDSIPLPAWDMVEFNRYSRETSMNAFVHSIPWAIIFTTRACPFQCAYCHNIFGKKIRKRSVENVMEEIELLTGRYGIRELHIVDDIFNLDLPRAKRICDEIIERGIQVKIAFPNGLRGDMMDKELIGKLKRAGCYCITYAVETASPRLQKAIRKNLDLDKVKQAITWTDQEGLIPQAFFMLGFPGETLEEMEMTIRYALESRILRPWVFTVVVYPRTGLLDLAQKAYPDFDFSDWDHFDFDYWAENTLYGRAEGVDLFSIQRRAYIRFFLRPRVILKILWRFPKNKFMLRGFYWGARWTLMFPFRLEKLIREAGIKRRT
jgi:anaerobic magnesium-protoporphyrin IX monomethyl ester cyclase